MSHQALEDLSTRYDDSVRNSEGKVVQFKYGDDGLDPACLEGESSPVAFPRSWTHAKGIAEAGGRSLLPWEVKDILNQALDSDDFKRNCEPEYLNSVEDFVLEKVVQPMIATREKYGLYAADEFEEETEGMDLDLGADRAFFTLSFLAFPCSLYSSSVHSNKRSPPQLRLGRPSPTCAW